ncbi:hypothetical protein GCM10010174_69790 [Kutzneria viridogrisea]|uniref:Membrane protein YedE/YeeE n=1 Tax=Kutzneria viridogrisea TaxID=47990 RepID=A0ABR6BB14_9PSEU|nr:putative membrane protein YedE/YeeE [Kutzneria viridogrisea]
MPDVLSRLGRGADLVLRYALGVLGGLGLAVAGVLLSLAASADYGPSVGVVVLWGWLIVCVAVLVTYAVRDLKKGGTGA